MQNPKLAKRTKPSGTSPQIISGHNYAWDVVEGKVLACRWVKLACERYISDERDRQHDPSFPYRFNAARGLWPIQIAEQFPHVKGAWAGRREKLKLKPWQCFIYMNIFGWVEKEHSRLDSEGEPYPPRRFLRTKIYVPRKNSKSTMMAPVALYMLACDEEEGAEICIGATNEQQADFVFGSDKSAGAKQMAEGSPEWRNRFGVQVNAKTIVQYKTHSSIYKLIGKPGEGSSPSCSIHDEYHEHDTDQQVNAMATGMAAREQPLQVIISTAGSNLAGPCFRDWKNCQKLLEGSVIDERTFAIIYSADEDDPWDAEETLIKANPLIDEPIIRRYKMEQLKEAKQNPEKQSEYKTKHLNIWTTAKHAYFDVDSWMKKGTVEGLELEDFINQPCHAGLDLALNNDLSSLAFVFSLKECDCEKAEGLLAQGFKYAVFQKSWLPEAVVSRVENEHYRTWAMEGYLTVTDGNTADQVAVENQIVLDAGRFTLMSLAYDPTYAHRMAQNLQDEHGLNVVAFTQGEKYYSAPMQAAQGHILEGEMAHNGDKLFAWAISNVINAKSSLGDKARPYKESPELKIDPAQAMLMGLARWISEGVEDAGEIEYTSGQMFAR